MKMIHQPILLSLPTLLLLLVVLPFSPVSAEPQAQLRPPPALPQQPEEKTLVFKEVGFLINEDTFGMEELYVEAYIKEDDLEFQYIADVDDAEEGLLTYRPKKLTIPYPNRNPNPITLPSRNPNPNADQANEANEANDQPLINVNPTKTFHFGLRLNQPYPVAIPKPGADEDSLPAPMTVEDQLRSRLMKPIFEHDADSKRARDFAARWDRWFGGSTPLHLPEGVGAGGAGVDGVDGAAGRAGMTEEQREQREQRKQQQQQEDELLWQNAERNGFEIDKPVKLHVLYRDGSDTYSANVVIPAHAFDEYELTFKTRSSNTYTSKLYRMEPGSQIGSGE